HHHRAIAAGEEMLEGENLPPVAQRALRQETQFRQAVEDDAAWIDLLDALEDELGRLAQFHLRRMEDGQLPLGIDRRFRRYQLKDVDAVERPAMASRHQLQLTLGLGQGDIENALSQAHAFEQELQRDRGLAGTRAPLIKIKTVRVEATAENVVEAGAA